MNNTEQKLILDFMASQPMAVIATNSPTDAAPESALVAFVEQDDLSIMFETFNTSRKFANLRMSQKISMVIGTDPKQKITLQYEGVAEPIPAGETDAAITIFLSKDTPCTEAILRDPRAQLYRVRPTWVRYSDYSGPTPVIIEDSF